jgi:hypothetical protein
MCSMVFSAWDVRRIRDLRIKGLMPDVIIQIFRSDDKSNGGYWSDMVEARMMLQ